MRTRERISGVWQENEFNVGGHKNFRMLVPWTDRLTIYRRSQ